MGVVDTGHADSDDDDDDDGEDDDEKEEDDEDDIGNDDDEIETKAPPGDASSEDRTMSVGARPPVSNRQWPAASAELFPLCVAINVATASASGAISGRGGGAEQ